MLNLSPSLTTLFSHSHPPTLTTAHPQVAELRELWEALHRNTAQFADLFGRALPVYDLVAPTPAAVLEELGLSVPGGATAGGASGARYDGSRRR